MSHRLQPIIAEVIRILKDKFTWSPDELQRVDRTMRRLGEVVTPTKPLNVIATDPDDDRIVEAAVAGKCEAIITGDKVLLRLGSYEGIKSGNRWQ